MRTQAKNILVPFRSPETSTASLRHAIDICNFNNAQITALHVLAAPSSSQQRVGLNALGYLSDVLWYESAQDRFTPTFLTPAMLQPVQQRIRDQVKAIAGREADVEVAIVVGKVAPAIVRYAEMNDVDLIVMGNRNYRPFRQESWTIPQQVAAAAHCPVWLIESEPQAITKHHLACNP